MNKILYIYHILIFTLVQAAALLMLACPSDGGRNTTDIETSSVIFDNTDGQCSVKVYTSSGREEGSLAAEVAAGTRSEEQMYQTTEHELTVYFSYIINLYDVPIIYTPRLPNGVQTIRIASGKTNKVIIPSIDTTVQSVAPLIENVYIVIKNDSAFSVSLIKGFSIMKPENYEAAESVSSYIVSNGEKAIYQLNLNGSDTEDAQIYKLDLLNGSTLNLHTIVPVVQAGHIYNIVVNGQSLAALAPALVSNKPITMAEVTAESETPNEQRLNKTFSFTKWHDIKKDPVTGEYVKDPVTGKDVPGDNTIEFYGNSARLNGSYWSHPAGRYNYSGQILESQASINLQGIAIRLNRSTSDGFVFDKQPGDIPALQLRSASERHPFYQQ